MVVKIRARSIRNRYPRNNSLIISIDDAKQGKDFTNFKSFTGDAEKIAIQFASSIFADSSVKPSPEMIDSLGYTFGLLRMTSKNFLQTRRGEKILSEAEAKKQLSELKKINKIIIENIGNVKLGTLLKALEKEKLISIGKRPEDILTIPTYEKIKKSNLLVRDLKEYEKIKQFTNQDYLKEGSKQEDSPERRLRLDLDDKKEVKVNSIMNAFDNSKIIFNSTYLKMNMKTTTDLISIDTKKYLSDLFDLENYPRIEDEDFPFLKIKTNESMKIAEIEGLIDDYFNKNTKLIDDMKSLMQGDSEESEEAKREFKKIPSKSRKLYQELSENDFVSNFSLTDNYFISRNKIKRRDFLLLRDNLERIVSGSKPKKTDDLETDSSSTQKQENKKELFYDSILKTISILKESIEKGNLIILKRTFNEDKTYVEEDGYEVYSIFGTEKTGLTLEKAYDIIKEEYKKLSKKDAIKDMIRNDIRAFTDFDDVHDIIISYLTPMNQELEVGTLDIPYKLTKTKMLDSYENFEEYIIYDKQVGIKVGTDKQRNRLSAAKTRDPQTLQEVTDNRPRNERGTLTFGDRFGDKAINTAKQHVDLLSAISEFETYIDSDIFNFYYQFDRTGFTKKQGVSADMFLQYIFGSNNRTLVQNVETATKKIKKILEMIDESTDVVNRLQRGVKKEGEKDENIYIAGEQAREVVEEDPLDNDVIEGYTTYVKLITNYSITDGELSSKTTKKVTNFDISSIFYFYSQNELRKLAEIIEKINEELKEVKSGNLKNSELRYNLLDLWKDFRFDTKKDLSSEFIELFEEDELDTSARLNDEDGLTTTIDEGKFYSKEYEEVPMDSKEKAGETYIERDGKKYKKIKDGGKQMPPLDRYESEMLSSKLETVSIVKLNKIELRDKTEIKVTQRAGNPSSNILSGSGSGTPPTKLNSKDANSLLAASANYENLIEGI